MNTVSTHDAAEHMLKTKRYYTAGLLAKELNISSKKATGLLYNIRTTPKYTVDESPLPNRQVKVLKIYGRGSCEQHLWSLALFGQQQIID